MVDEQKITAELEYTDSRGKQMFRPRQLEAALHQERDQEQGRCRQRKAIENRPRRWHAVDLPRDHKPG